MQNENFRILIIEDDADISELVRLGLQLKNYQVEMATSGSLALTLIEKNNFDLFIIDRMLPDTNGLDICRYVRNHQDLSNKPIILLTALSEANNIIEGLDAGADDYISKPFDMNILHARVRALLRRVNINSSVNSLEVLRFGDLELDIKKCRVKIGSEVINLTNTEFQILTVLAKEPGIVHTRQKLIATILGDVFVTNRTIDTHIAGLRKKLAECSNLIETIRGVGYRLQDNET